MKKSNIDYKLTHQEENEQDYYLRNYTDSNLEDSVEPVIPLWRQVFQTSSLIGVYFVLSVGLTFYLQWFYSSYGFHYPLTVVICHLIIKYTLSSIIRLIRRIFYDQPIQLQWQSIIFSLAPPGIASGLDVGLSNWSLSLITISLYTMTKSTTIIFILIFSLIFKLEKKSWSLVGIVLMISIGLIMFTYKSTQFHLFGFILCMLASFSGGIRWTMAQIIMQKSKLGLHNPVDMIYHMQPWMLIAVLPVTVWFEGQNIYNDLINLDWKNYMKMVSISVAIVGSAFLAFSMEIAEFLVVTYTSSLTLSITGILKEIVMLILAVECKGDQMSILKFIGLLVCLGGIILHTTKILFKKKKQNYYDHLELQANSLTSVNLKPKETTEINLPLLQQKSTSLTNLLNGNYTSEEEDEDIKRESPSQLLYNIKNRREQT